MLLRYPQVGIGVFQLSSLILMDPTSSATDSSDLSERKRICAKNTLDFILAFRTVGEQKEAICTSKQEANGRL